LNPESGLALLQNEAEADAIGGFLRRARVTMRGEHGSLIVAVPRTAALHLVPLLRVEPVLTPLPNISAQVIESESVGRIRADRCGRGCSILLARELTLEVTKSRLTNQWAKFLAPIIS
jgi:hypothetical protein